MKKLIILAAMTMLFGAISAQAGEGSKGGLGFHLGNSLFSNVIFAAGPEPSPTIGLRQWFSPQMGADIALGYVSLKAEQATQSETWTGYSFDLGLPLMIKKFDKVNFIFRPGFQYGTLDDKDETAIPTLTTKWTGTGFSGELEAEWMVADNVSISASHGLAYTSMKDDQTPELKFTSFGSTGRSFTELGFTIYLW